MFFEHKLQPRGWKCKPEQTNHSLRAPSPHRSQKSANISLKMRVSTNKHCPIESCALNGAGTPLSRPRFAQNKRVFLNQEPATPKNKICVLSRARRSSEMGKTRAVRFAVLVAAIRNICCPRSTRYIPGQLHIFLSSRNEAYQDKLWPSQKKVLDSLLPLSSQIKTLPTDKIAEKPYGTVYRKKLLNLVLRERERHEFADKTHDPGPSLCENRIASSSIYTDVRHHPKCKNSFGGSGWGGGGVSGSMLDPQWLKTGRVNRLPFPVQGSGFQVK